MKLIKLVIIFLTLLGVGVGIISIFVEKITLAGLIFAIIALISFITYDIAKNTNKKSKWGCTRQGD